MNKYALIVLVVLVLTACSKEPIIPASQFEGQYEWSNQSYDLKSNSQKDFTDIVLDRSSLKSIASFNSADSTLIRVAQGFGISNKRYDGWRIEGDSLLIDDYGNSVQGYLVDIKDSIFINLISKNDTVYLKKIGKIEKK